MGLKKGTTLISTKDRKALIQLGARIKEIREKKNLTVYDLTGEDLLIKSRQHWQKIELGKMSITFTTFLKVAKSLGVSPIELLKGIL